MKDKLIEGYLKDFVDAHELTDLPESEAFEHFVNYCVACREHPENTEFESMRIGGSGDMGIDGIAILVNQHIVSSKEDVNFFSAPYDASMSASCSFSLRPPNNLVSRILAIFSMVSKHFSRKNQSVR